MERGEEEEERDEKWQETAGQVADLKKQTSEARVGQGEFQQQWSYVRVRQQCYRRI